MPNIATNIIEYSFVNSICGIKVENAISPALPPTITAVITYANNYNAVNFNTLTNLLYGRQISENRINTVKPIVAINGVIWRNNNLTEEAITPMSTPIFMVLATIRRVASGNNILFEYFSFMTLPKPEPVARPILPHIS